MTQQAAPLRVAAAAHLAYDNQYQHTSHCRKDTVMSQELIVVTGAGGFIGGHLMADLRRQGHGRLRAVDCKPAEAWWQRFADVENLQLDLRRREDCEQALAGATTVYNLAADMGG